MPYVDDSRRVGTVGKMQVDSPGDLTYAFQQLILKYIEKHGLRYQSITEVLGSLEGAKFDFTDRVVRNYEREKREESGDVWPPDLTGEEKEILTNPDVQIVFDNLTYEGSE